MSLLEEDAKGAHQAGVQSIKEKGLQVVSVREIILNVSLIQESFLVESVV